MTITVTKATRKGKVVICELSSGYVVALPPSHPFAKVGAVLGSTTR